MPGPLPMAESERAGRSKPPTIPTTNLPVSGYRGDFPEPPSTMPDELVAEYRSLWRSPMGAAWIEEDAELVVELVELRDLCSKSRRRGEYPPGTAATRISGIEDRLGLSPKSRAAMRWRIVDDPPDVDESDGTVLSPEIAAILDRAKS